MSNLANLATLHDIFNVPQTLKATFLAAVQVQAISFTVEQNSTFENRHEHLLFLGLFLS
jgi:hypothetical protein